jgi:hypothetical protein
LKSWPWKQTITTSISTKILWLRLYRQAVSEEVKPSNLKEVVENVVYKVYVRKIKNQVSLASIIDYKKNTSVLSESFRKETEYSHANRGKCLSPLSQTFQRTIAEKVLCGALQKE